MLISQKFKVAFPHSAKLSAVVITVGLPPNTGGSTTIISKVSICSQPLLSVTVTV